MTSCYLNQCSPYTLTHIWGTRGRWVRNNLASVGAQWQNNASKFRFTWWRHQMETYSALLAICAGKSQVPSEFPTQRPVTRSFDVFFDLHLNKQLSKQWWGWWFQTPPRPLWRHSNDLISVSRERCQPRSLLLAFSGHLVTMYYTFKLFIG